MKADDVDEFFASLDASLNGLSTEQAEKKISRDFPPYTHIGPYAHPGNIVIRRQVRSAVRNSLRGTSLNPLLSFEMSQPKYSGEFLPPDCNCYRRVKIKKRPIKSCSHLDRLFYASWNHYLSLHHKSWVNSNGLDDVVSAYIPATGKFNAHYAKVAFDYIQGRNEYSAVALDVKSFFDELPHAVLKENLLELVGQSERLSETDHRLFLAVTRYSYCEKSDIDGISHRLLTAPGILFTNHRSNWELLRKLKLIHQNGKKGIPQGLACSGVLANITMMRFDLEMHALATANDSIYIRYADDIFISAPNKTIREQLELQATSKLTDMCLPLAPKKTEYFDFSLADTVHPIISYLGLTCQGNEVSVRRGGINKFYDRTKRYIFSYVMTCRLRGRAPAISTIRAKFSHNGNRNYYSYLRRASRTFEDDSRYKAKGIKGVLKRHTSWIDKTFREAENTKLSEGKRACKGSGFCNCHL